jgi:hypothetical protein
LEALQKYFAENKIDGSSVVVKSGENAVIESMKDIIRYVEIYQSKFTQ